MRKRFGKWLGERLSVFCFFLLAGIVCAPIAMLAFGALKDNNELLDELLPVMAETKEMTSWRLFPVYPTLVHFKELLIDTPQFYTVFFNSVKLVAGILAGRLVVAVPAAWAFARFEFPWKRPLFLVYVVLMLMPFQVTMLPNYLVLNRMQLLNTHAAIILPAVFSTFPVFLMYRGFRGIPDSVIEAAKIDGAGEWKIFFRIGVPLGSTGILSALVLGFLDCWNLVEQPLAFLEDKSLWPLSLYLPEIDISHAGLALASSVITLIPAAFVFVMGQEYLEQGIIAAGVKE